MKMLLIVTIMAVFGMTMFTFGTGMNLSRDHILANNGYSKKCIFCNGTGFKGSFNCNQCKGTGRL